MNQDQVVNLIQTFGKVAGGVLAGHGIGNSATTEAAIGLAIAIASWWFSHRSNKTPAPPAS